MRWEAFWQRKTKVALIKIEASVGCERDRRLKSHWLWTIQKRHLNARCKGAAYFSYMILIVLYLVTFHHWASMLTCFRAKMLYNGLTGWLTSTFFGLAACWAKPVTMSASVVFVLGRSAFLCCPFLFFDPLPVPDLCLGYISLYPTILPYVYLSAFESSSLSCWNSPDVTVQSGLRLTKQVSIFFVDKLNQCLIIYCQNTSSIELKDAALSLARHQMSFKALLVKVHWLAGNLPSVQPPLHRPVSLRPAPRPGCPDPVSPEPYGPSIDPRRSHPDVQQPSFIGSCLAIWRVTPVYESPEEGVDPIKYKHFGRKKGWIFHKLQQRIWKMFITHKKSPL